MSSTLGIQNYLSNVFRPVYTFDPAAAGSPFVAKLELSNIDTYSGNTVSVFTAAIGDSNSNVYVGSNAGNPYNITKNCFKVTALGYGAGSNISNDSNSVYIGWYAGSEATNAQDVISIGTNSGGNGMSNIFLGTNTGTVGTCNILIGHYMDPGNISNQVRFGFSNQIPLVADISKKWVGVGGVLAPTDTYGHFDVSGNARFQGQVGINVSPIYTLDVNGTLNVDDGHGNLVFSNGTAQATVGYTSFQSNIAMSGGGDDKPMGMIRKGIIHACALDPSNSANYAAVTYFAYGTSYPNAVVMSSNISNGSIFINLSNIYVKINSTDVNPINVKTSITYFPLP